MSQTGLLLNSNILTFRRLFPREIKKKNMCSDIAEDAVLIYFLLLFICVDP